jgi:hypothetical protein
MNEQSKLPLGYTPEVWTTQHGSLTVDCGSTECEATVAQYINPCIGSKAFCV